MGTCPAESCGVVEDGVKSVARVLEVLSMTRFTVLLIPRATDSMPLFTALWKERARESRPWVKPEAMEERTLPTRELGFEDETKEEKTWETDVLKSPPNEIREFAMPEKLSLCLNKKSFYLKKMAMTDFSCA